MVSASAVTNATREGSRASADLRDKEAALRVHQREPFNAGPALDRLRERFVTPKENFFVRNHGNIPIVNPSDYSLVVQGLTRSDLRLSLSELQICFPRVSLPATIACAGIRRDELNAVREIPRELPWGAEPVGNAVWTGIRLRDVLERAGAGQGAKHVCFTGLDEVEREGEKFGFGGSIPVEKAMSADVLLAYEMNGEPLAAIHGAPLRVVVPGYIGARSVKWLGAITLAAAPSQNYFQQRAYKTFAPEVTAATVNWSEGAMLAEHPVNTVICSPCGGESLGGDHVVVRGFSFTGNGEAVARVEVSADGGATWQRAEIQEGASRWTWAFWQARLRLPRGEHIILARATDARGASQPSAAADVWNFKGYLNNSWHSVRFKKIE